MSDESTLENSDDGLEMLNDDEMELLFKKEVNYWLQANGHQLFEESFAKCINVPQRRKVVVNKDDKGKAIVKKTDNFTK